MTERLGDRPRRRNRSAQVATARSSPKPDVLVRAAATGADPNLGARQLRRRFADAVGYGPKTLQQYLRFQRFLALAQTRHGPRPGSRSRPGTPTRRTSRANARGSPGCRPRPCSPPVPGLPGEVRFVQDRRSCRRHAGGMSIDLDAATTFIYAHAGCSSATASPPARRGRTEPVVQALRAYRNDDGGFGHASSATCARRSASPSASTRRWRSSRGRRPRRRADPRAPPTGYDGHARRRHPVLPAERPRLPAQPGLAAGGRVLDHPDRRQRGGAARARCRPLARRRRRVLWRCSRRSTSRPSTRPRHRLRGPLRGHLPQRPSGRHARRGRARRARARHRPRRRRRARRRRADSARPRAVPGVARPRMFDPADIDRDLDALAAGSATRRLDVRLGRLESGRHARVAGRCHPQRAAHLAGQLNLRSCSAFEVGEDRAKCAAVPVLIAARRCVRGPRCLRRPRLLSSRHPAWHSCLSAGHRAITGTHNVRLTRATALLVIRMSACPIR